MNIEKINLSRDKRDIHAWNSIHIDIFLIAEKNISNYMEIEQDLHRTSHLITYILYKYGPKLPYVDSINDIITIILRNSPNISFQTKISKLYSSSFANQKFNSLLDDFYDKTKYIAICKIVKNIDKHYNSPVRSSTHDNIFLNFSKLNITTELVKKDIEQELALLSPYLVIWYPQSDRDWLFHCIKCKYI
jgi:hypothetical protein